MRRLLKFIIALTITILVVSSISIYASTGDVAPIEEGTKLAKLLETYGVPTAIAAVISSFGTGGAVWLLTKGFRNSKGQMIKALEKMGLTEVQLTNLMNKLNQVESKLEAVEADFTKNMNNTYQERVIPLLQEVKELASDLNATKEEVKNSSLKIINLLTEDVKEENNKVSEV